MKNWILNLDMQKIFFFWLQVFRELFFEKFYQDEG